MTAGFAAVAGATVVGLKQSKIASRQADILAHQVEVDRAKLRADLFERRLEVYKAFKDYIRDAIGLRADFDPTPAIFNAMSEQLEQAQFLFTGAVRTTLIATAQLSDEFLAEREELRDLRQQQADRVDHPFLRQQIDSLSTTIERHRKDLLSMLGGLADAMGEEMRLFIPVSQAASTKNGLMPR